MWHPFDIMADQAAADPAVRGAAPAPACRLVYSDRILARFPTKDKIGTDKQWRPQVDKLPGVTLLRQAPVNGAAELGVEQRWQFAAVDHRLNGKLTVKTDGWRTPLNWSFRQEVTPHKERPALTPLEERGEWSDGTIRRWCKPGGGAESSSQKANALASLYALIADFPRDLAERGGEGAAVLLDGFAIAPAAGLAPGHAPNRELPLARGLKNYLLRHDGGLPFEFWVNDAGMVVYVCQGPTRALVLESLEALA